ncbi:long-subunit fatty acid transport protein [Primorskyibacter sedentarius]|uniref:Long-subunit fatty acid transport protein n=1 Tax=Primorskyibacter sedentarius TaxID=745311 RepID=A0A4R3J380_9RHOB|nr:outer membrane protein transport protein [Primorskyibacter sedentarius]TCS59080.1 long-subunit fatty acid transport protein [Primorskyibacter sedentarius]
MTPRQRLTVQPHDDYALIGTQACGPLREEDKMKVYVLGASVAALCATGAVAGGIERNSNNYGLLYEDGNQIELTFAHISPTVKGKYVGGGSTGDMAGDYTSTGVAYKTDITDQLSFGLYFNDGYGADSTYSEGFYTGLNAEWDSTQTAVILKYQATDRISVYGGVRYVESSADITIPDQMIRKPYEDGAAQATAGAAAAEAAYGPADPRTIGAQQLAAQLNAVATSTDSLEFTAQAEKDGRFGYVLGAAYEIPDIALRVGLTWQSAITHEFDTTENSFGFGVIGVESTTEIEMPQSVALDFQTGVAKDTLVFGQVKWVEWSKWEVRTQEYETVTGDAITGIDDDVITWQLGVGRRFSDEFSGFARVTYEKSNGGIASRLAPTDGRISLGVGGTYTDGAMKLRGGIEFAKLGDAEDGSGTKFESNTLMGIGAAMTFAF